MASGEIHTLTYTHIQTHARLRAGGNGGSSLFKKKKLLKNPEAETSFLPDPDRERAEQELREKLKLEWLAEQERVQSAWCLYIAWGWGVLWDGPLCSRIDGWSRSPRLTTTTLAHHRSTQSDEMLEVTYSYWDGSGHRRVLKVRTPCMPCR